MLINAIINKINRKLAGELLAYNELIDFMDNVIDDINTELNTTLPAFSEIDEGIIDYVAIPDKYIRSVVIPGTAFYYYQADEEGIDSAVGYKETLLKGLYFMKRDFSEQIPLEYRATSMGGVVFTVEDEITGTGVRGVEIDGSIWNL